MNESYEKRFSPYSDGYGQTGGGLLFHESESVLFREEREKIGKDKVKCKDVSFPHSRLKYCFPIMIFSQTGKNELRAKNRERENRGVSIIFRITNVRWSITFFD